MTTFISKWLINLTEKDVKHAQPKLCIPCVNWKRRCVYSLIAKKNTPTKPALQRKTTFKPQRFTKPLLQIDQMILFAMNPGKFLLPDKRCVLRLIDSLKDSENYLVRLAVPDAAKEIVSGVTEREDKKLIVCQLTHSWWKYNGYTHFFTHAGTARLVRLAIKHVGSPGNDETLFSEDEESDSDSDLDDE